jgi:hypothetical protein
MRRRINHRKGRRCKWNVTQSRRGEEGMKSALKSFKEPLQSPEQAFLHAQL